MKTIPASIDTEHSKKVSTIARIWQITRLDGTVLRYTDFQRDLPVGGNTYLARVGVNPSSAQSSYDMSVANMQVSGVLSDAAITEADLYGGLYDGATVVISEVDWKNPTDTYITFEGEIGVVRTDDHTFTAELLSVKQKFMREYGRSHQERCDVEVLGDARCGISVASYTFTGAVTAVTDQSNFTGDTSQATDYFSYGVVTFTSGSNVNVSREVETHVTGDIFTMFEKFPFPIQIGDTYSAVAGCPRLASVCKAKFSNLVNFRGFAAVDSGGADIPIIPGNTKLNQGVNA